MSNKLSAEEISVVSNNLNDTNRPIAQRFQSLFALRNSGGTDSIDQISKCLLNDESALLKHECAYCLGQIQDIHAIPVLNKVLSNTSEHPMVRHEAAEALGAIGDSQSLDILKKYSMDSNKSVSETCLLAIKRIEYLINSIKENVTAISSHFNSVDPVPAIDLGKNDVSKLEEILIDENNDLFSRYRAMFALRNIDNNESAIALAKGLKCGDSALFRHEVAYVLGQMQNSVVIQQLAQVLEDSNEDEMVRHECAEALGSIATPEADRVLNKYIKDPQRVVRESVEVALDISDYNNSDSFQFINLSKVKTQTILK